MKKEWIPVSERLPEIGDYVLLCFREGRDCPFNRIAVGKLGSHEVVDKDFTIIGAKTVWYTDRWYCDFDRVIAWMPLPEPYKEDEMTRCIECKYLSDVDIYVGYCEKHKCEMLDIIHGGCSVGKPYSNTATTLVGESKEVTE